MHDFGKADLHVSFEGEARSAFQVFRGGYRSRECLGVNLNAKTFSNAD